MFRLPIMGIRQWYPRAKNDATLKAIHEHFLSRNAKPKPQVSPVKAIAEIRCGCWVFTCPHCNTDVAATPPVCESRCFGCGAIFPNVLFPSEWHTIEKLLEVRPRLRQGWLADETVDQIRAENVEHGFPPDADTRDD